MSSADTTYVWTDGSCVNNGTPSATAAIGIYYGPADKRNYSSRLIVSRQTNNKAELIAILYALIYDFNSTNVVVRTDSKYSIDCVTVYVHKWQINGWKTSVGGDVESADIIRSIVDVIATRLEHGLDTKFEHVKGHSGDVGNSAADRLARLGATQSTEGGRIVILRKCGFPV